MNWHDDPPPPRRLDPEDRLVLVDVLVYHARRENAHCLCGWGGSPRELGLSHAEHVADVYDQSLRTGFVKPTRPRRESV